ncbi:vacuolar membrane protein [Ophiostoma piceae UAMH 11346]|uniref:Vacuolar membrane protein n=1 Tax=Ophiostoma piceae (strain UAMH 11346) TaxID=1262450 RepID=S3C8B3_OPHP1|nr:vacuolar membrane protein [Ophiostoma piceae UAMH 11346]
MSWELTQRRISRAVNSKFIYGIPLLHSIIFFIEMAIVARLTSRFNAYYEERPLLTMMVTNTVLGGIADTVAQTITSFRQRRSATKAFDYEAADAKNNDDYSLSVELEPRGGPSRSRSTSPFISTSPSPSPSPSAPAKTLPPAGVPFDFERLTRFMGYGFLMAPIQFKWFKFLSTTFPIVKGGSALGPTLKRTAMDQLIFAPMGIACFFTVMTVSEGGGRRAVQTKLRDMYIPTLKANFVVWPAVQLINFRLMPVQFQLPFVSTVGIAWTAYLSLTNAAEDVAMNKAHVPDAPPIRLE